MFLQSSSSAALEKALDATWQRMNVISHNISNEDTPGYKAKRLNFESQLAAEIRKLQNTNNGNRQSTLDRLNHLQPQVYEDRSTIGRADGNNVDILAEQTELGRTVLYYQALSQRVSGHYSLLKYAISGGR